MTRSLFFLVVPVISVLLVQAADPKVISLGQDDQLNVKCVPAAATITVTDAVTSTITQAVTSTVTVSIAGSASASGTTTSPASLPTPYTPSPANNSIGGGFPHSTFGQRANYQPHQLPIDNVSHVLYAFADFSEQGEVKPSDSKLDVEARLATDSSKEAGNNVYGNVKQLYLLKKKNRGLKVLLSIGGGQATATKKFVAVAASEAGRRLFADSAAALMGDFGFDGIDIDWEFPEGAQQAGDFVKLLTACRGSLDRYAAQHAREYRFSITLAAPGDAYNYKMLDLAGMKPWVDQWHIMTYDFLNDPSGPNQNTTAHTANLYDNKANHLTTPESTDGTVKAFLAGGIAPANISIGLPMYGHFFQNTQATVGSPFDGTRVVPYNALPGPGEAQEFYDDGAGASYSYDGKTHELISYDTAASAVKKAAYLRGLGLGGAFFFEATEDKAGKESLVATMAGQLGPLDPTRNLLTYPGSKYDNIRAGVPGE